METDLLQIIEGVSMVIGGAAVLSAIIPQARAASPVLGLLRKLLDLAAMNIRNARNEQRKD